MRRKFRCLALSLILALTLSVPATALEAETLVPVGQTVGLELYTDGVFIVQLDGGNKQCPAKDAGLKPGDRLVSIDGMILQNATDLRARIAAGGGRRLTLAVERAGRDMSFSVQPVSTETGWRIGVLVQDRITGLGTVTFYDPKTGLFGALGHSVGKSGASGAAPLSGGSALPTWITGVQRGKPGEPGQLQGKRGGATPLGQVDTNTDSGVFGHCEEGAFSGIALPVATREEISTGPVEVWSNVAGNEIAHYSAEIEAIRFGTDDGRNLRLHVTDSRLLEQTGGIVQGMSGSPIIQNGKLVGAVTHVLIQDPTRGYGICIDNMLQAADTAEDAA